MCGIFGSVSKMNYKAYKLKHVIDLLFKLSESRGKEATGFAIKTANSVDVLKSPLMASQLVKTVTYKKLFRSTFDKLKMYNINQALAVIGHSRLATNGSEASDRNNHPVVKGNVICVHNGIITNDEQLWQEFPMLKRENEVDTEVFVSLLQLFLKETGSLVSSIRKIFGLIEGSASVAVLFNNNTIMLLATNTGSLYTCWNSRKDLMVFGSERYILEQLAKRTERIDSFEKASIQHLLPQTGLLIDIQTLNTSSFALSNDSEISFTMSDTSHPENEVVDHSKAENPIAFSELAIIKNNFILLPEVKKEIYETWGRLYSNNTLKRCTRCILPETMPFIEFDQQGVCNFCRDHVRKQKGVIKGEEALEEIVSKFRRTDGKYDCILPFSGGRDSTYGLHYVKKILRMNPIVYTYDWGLLTDLGRRNQARICGKLGIEHIIISADIKKKRKYVQRNLIAWLKKPNLGMIPLLMAGDKATSYYTHRLSKIMGIETVIYSAGGGRENETFKVGFTGTRMDLGYIGSIRALSRLMLAYYYAKNFIKNPSYFNQSFMDSISAFYYQFFFPPRTKWIKLFDYIKWDEETILSTISSEYNWEREPDTTATWRIDDGTAAFYNYIYMAVAGFTEIDTFRSFQIRENQLDREKAYELIKEENRPRYDSLEWYARTIGFDCNEAIRRINSMPRFYKS